MASFPTNNLTISELYDSQADVILLSVCSILPFFSFQLNFLNFLSWLHWKFLSEIKPGHYWWSNSYRKVCTTDSHISLSHTYWYWYYMCSLYLLNCLLVAQMERIFCTTAWKREVYRFRYTEVQADCPLENARLAFPFCCVNSQLPSETPAVVMDGIIHDW